MPGVFIHLCCSIYPCSVLYFNMMGNDCVMKCHRQNAGGLRPCSGGVPKVLPRQGRASRGAVVCTGIRKWTTGVVDGGALVKKIGAAVGHVSLVGVLLLSGGMVFLLFHAI